MILPPALVLTAGLGTRLRPLTFARAKAAVPVNGDTLARRAIRYLVGQDVTDIVLNLHHLPATVTASVGDGSDLGANVRYSWENPVLGSAGGPRHALPLLTGSADGGLRTNRESRTTRDPRPATRAFFIINGDTFTNVDLNAILARHDSSGALVTMALIPNPRPDKYGGVLVSDAGYVTGFHRAGPGNASFHFIGVQVAQSRAFERLDDGVPAESVNVLYPQLIAEDPRSIAAFVCDAAFHDIGTPADYLATSLELADIEGDRMISRTACVNPAARVTRTAIWDDARIGRGAALTECIVCDRVTVPEGRSYTRVAIIRRPDGSDDDLIVEAIDR
jgi:NDP-sugar pyrophosphorylase family protein